MTKPTHSRVFALVPAGGQSRRMGTNKLALPLGNQSVLERVVHALISTSIEHVLVVLGPANHKFADSIRPPIETLLIDQTHDMRQTIERGLAHWESAEHPRDEEIVLLALADQPTITPTVIRQVIAAAHRHPGRIVVPTFGAKRGHPVAIPWNIIRELSARPANEGLNALVRDEAHRVTELAVDDADIIADLDLPADYDRLRDRDWVD